METQVPLTAELKKQLIDDVAHYDIVDGMETLADISGKYIIGDVSVSACLGHIKLLMEAENPLVFPAEDGTSTMDDDSTIQAVYILDQGPLAMYPLQRIRQKKARLEKYANLSKGNPVYLQRMESLEDDIDDLEIEFENAANEHFKKFEHLDMMEVLEGLLTITDEITEVLDSMPASEGTDTVSKKKASRQKV
jgi:hypothetical protein|tara:strand:- start:354 stop:932 length:579 start_codon:yes stop_codon:yes gene_type:complete